MVSKGLKGIFETYSLKRCKLNEEESIKLQEKPTLNLSIMYLVSFEEVFDNN